MPPTAAAVRDSRVTLRAFTLVAAVLALVFTGSVLFYTNRDTVELTALLSNEVDVVVPLSE